VEILTPPEALPPVLIEQEAGWARASVWTNWRRHKSLPSAGNRTPDRPARSLVTVINHDNT